MDKNYKDFKLEDFLEDSEFCEWSKGFRQDLDEHFSKLLAEYPHLKDDFQLVRRIVRFLDDKKAVSDPLRKLQIWEGINKTYQRQKRTAKIRLSFKYAAVFILALTVVSSIVFVTKSQFDNDFESAEYIENLPNTKLMLDNGKEINIKSERSEIDYAANNQKIQIDNKLVNKSTQKQEIQENELIVAYGNQSKIVLPDHSEVWVNAGSRLVFPSTFSGKNRKVQLQGEAFFKVTKDKTKPFIVETSDMKVRVLGTSFNVKAYIDEKYHESVLVEGAISLELGNSLLSKSIMVKPNQRVVLDSESSDYTISTVDVNDYTSWVNGLFIFNDEPIPSVLKRVSRFYNLKIKWDHSIEDIKISGKLDLKEDYEPVLRTLSLISDGNFSVRQGIIYYNQNIFDMK